MNEESEGLEAMTEAVRGVNAELRDGCLEFGLLRLRMIAADMMELRAGLERLGKMEALAERLRVWSDGLIGAERTISGATGQPIRNRSTTTAKDPISTESR